MFEKIEEKLDNSALLCAVVKGLCIVIAITAGIICFGSIICAFLVSWWWGVVSVPAGAVCGVSTGIGMYLSD